MAISSIYDQGNVFSVDVLDVSEDVLIGRFLSGVKAIATISLALNYPTLASVTHSLVNSYKNLLAVSVSTDYTFEAAQKVKDYLENPEAFASAAPAAAAEEAAPAAAAEAPKEEEKEGECWQYLIVSVRPSADLHFYHTLQSPTTTWASVSSTKRFALYVRPGWVDVEGVARDEPLYGVLLQSVRSVHLQCHLLLQSTQPPLLPLSPGYLPAKHNCPVYIEGMRCQSYVT
jgi:hypothetical protein